MLAEEVASAQATAAREQVLDKARASDQTQRVDITQQSAAQCPKCGAAASGRKFCPECGAPLIPKGLCPQCKAKVPAGAKFCPECGAKT